MIRLLLMLCLLSIASVLGLNVIQKALQRSQGQPPAWATRPKWWTNPANLDGRLQPWPSEYSPLQEITKFATEQFPSEFPLDAKDKARF